MLIEWENNEKTLEELKVTIERYSGHAWIEGNKSHQRIYQLWSLFRDEAIFGIGGMTINERLYYFSLFDRFNVCKNEKANPGHTKNYTQNHNKNIKNSIADNPRTLNDIDT